MVIVVCMRGKCDPKSTMLKDRDYDVTPYIIAHMYPQSVFFFRGLLLVSYDLQLSHFVS